MLRVRLEIVPFGNETHTREIGRLDIFNRGCPEAADGQQQCFYGVIELTPSNGGLYKEPVFHFRPEGAWKLVAKAIAILGISGP